MCFGSIFCLDLKKFKFYRSVGFCFIRNFISCFYLSLQAFLKVMGLQSSTFYMSHGIAAYLKTTVVILTCALLLLSHFEV